MKRTIKFKGMDINGNWYIGNLAIVTAKGKEGTYISNSVGIPLAYKVRPETIGQFTGLTDKNGTEIYEGDILSDYKFLDENIGNVEWTGCSFVWNVSGLTRCNLMNHKELVVIKNIHDNPELL